MGVAPLRIHTDRENRLLVTTVPSLVPEDGGLADDDRRR